MPHATRLLIEGGVKVSLTAVGAPVGTTVRVEDLFMNVPARLKFLKQDQTERIRIDQVVAHYAFAYPEVQFHLVQESKNNLTTSGNGNRAEVLIMLLGLDTAKQMIEVVYEEPEIKVYGFISPPSLTRSNRKEIHFYVNRRPIQDSSLASAAIQAYHTYLMVGRYPIVKLFIDMDPAKVDVNVHPAKAEVRFANPNWIFSQVQHAVRRALLAASPIPQITSSIWQPSWDLIEREKESGELNQPRLYPPQPDLIEAQSNIKLSHMPLLRLV
jgi:DNA mismatch repair protein MutL